MTNNIKAINFLKLCIISLILILYIGFTPNALGETPSNEDYKGAAYCANCHTDPMIGWLQSPHALAFSNKEFQEEWKRLGSIDSCLSCHTTGYEDKGVYEYKEVTCEACHGPGDTMNRNTSSELCGSCHSYLFPTYEEWKDSGPSHGNATCTLCHDEHTSKLTAETSVGTCAICHESHKDDVQESKHANEVECADCHMYSSPANFEKGTPAVTGHTFMMSPDELDCSTCHDRPLSKHDVLGEKGFACLSCHGDIHELRLKLVNGSVYEPDDPVSLCAQCHNARYVAWRQGTHGKPEDPDASCTECHDPHNPIVSEIPTLQAIPPRVSAPNLPFPISTAFTVVLGILGLAVIILRWRNNV